MYFGVEVLIPISLIILFAYLSSRWFRDTSMILFLNKKDLFAEKIKKVPITNCVCFANYSGPNEYNAASEFIKQAFEDSNKSPDSMQSITVMNSCVYFCVERVVSYVLYVTCCRCVTFTYYSAAKEVYTHVTCATDTENIKVVFNAVKDIVIRKSLRDGGLL